MERASILATLVLSGVCWAAGPAYAQQEAAPAAEAEASASSSMVTTAPKQVSQEQWWQIDLEEAKLRSKRTRNALIGTSAAFGVGAIITGVGGSQCEQVPQEEANTYDNLLCNNAGKVMIRLGGAIAGLSLVGMLTSGIMLGVSNKRKREIQRDLRRIQYGRKLQWDIPKGAFVF